MKPIRRTKPSSERVLSRRELEDRIDELEAELDKRDAQIEQIAEILDLEEDGLEDGDEPEDDGEEE